MSRPTSPVEEEDSAGAARAPDRYHLLRNRNFVCYLSGRFIASFGGQMLAAAVGWDIYERTHSALPLGLVGLAQIAPLLLFTLPAGHAADNFPRKSIILLSEAVMFASCVALAVVALTRAPVGWMYLFLFLNGIARTFLWPASAAFLPQLVPRADFPTAVAWNSTSFQLSAVIGPAIGGAIIARFGSAAPVYFLNAGAAAAYGLLLTMVRPPPTILARQKMTLQTLLAGFRFVYQTRLILGVITLDLFAVLFGGATALLPVYASDILHRGPASLGLLQSALPFGSFLMAFILAHRPPMRKAGKALISSVVIFGVATIVFGFSRNFWLSFFAMAICGAVDNISIVVRHTLVQLLTPDEMRGRVSAVNSLFIGTSNEFGDFESGFVAHLTGPVAAVVSGGIGTLLVVAVVAFLFPEIRKRGSLAG